VAGDFGKAPIFKVLLRQTTQIPPQCGFPPPFDPLIPLDFPFPIGSGSCGVMRVKPIARTSAVDLVVEALRTECASGKWDDRLPGTRVLAERLGVSPPTVSAALAKLAEAKILHGGGERRAYRVTKKRSSALSSSKTNDKKRLLILTHEDLGQIVDISRHILEKLWDRMSGKGWTVEVRTLDYLHVKKMQRSWDRLIEVDRNTSVIAMYGRVPLAEWAIKRNVRMLFLGGVTGGLPVSVVGVKASTMVADAMAKLTALGHKRIVIPLCDRTESFKVAIQDVTRKAIESTGSQYVQSYHNPDSDYLTPDVTWRIIESVFSKEAPTAFVLLDWKELVTVHCLMARLGLKIPEDASVILLNEPSEIAWFHPALAHFRYPVRRILLELARWLEDESREARAISLAADYVAGDSIAKAKR
jgi:DNA-binding LacI/PurR family transcriptional regulator